MVLQQNRIQNQRIRKGLLVLFLMLRGIIAESQEIVWEKRIPLKKDDQIFCMAKDTDGNIYLGGNTMRSGVRFIATDYYRALLVKLNPEGDTIYTRILPEYGSVLSIVQDKFNVMHINVKKYSLEPSYSEAWVLLKMSSDGFIFRRDTIVPTGEQPYPYHCLLASDSSVLITGNKPNNNRNGMFFQRVNPDYSLGEFRLFQPNNTSTEGKNIEELPNGRIMISGPFSNRLGSVEMDKDGNNDSSWTWQSDTSANYYQNAAFVSQTKEKGFLGRVDGRLRWYDSLRNKFMFIKPYYAVWNVVTPHSDGSFIYNETNGGNVSHLIKRSYDSTIVWNFNIADPSSSVPFSIKSINCSIYNDDQSAIFAGNVGVDTAYRSDPYLIKIANVGTPVTSLVKPQKGILANESLAPWPNPGSTTVYLKQHFHSAEVRLYNLSGKEMGYYQLRFAQPIDVSGYRQGIYLYRAIIDGKAYSGKIIKR